MYLFQLNEALLNIYGYLQRIAVGLEQIVWDQEDTNGIFHDDFSKREYQLRALLCEIHVAMDERGILQRHENVSRDIMGDDHRQISDSSKRHLRDFVIFREYMNALEYVIDVFEHFERKL